MKIRQTGVYITVILLAAVFLILAFTITPLSEITLTSDAAYPIFIAGMCALFAIWIVVSEERKRKRDTQPPAQTQESAQYDAAVPENRILTTDALVLIGLIVLYGVLLMLAGYIIATLAFTVGSIYYLQRRDFKTGLLVGFISTFLIVLVFKYGFSVILP